jgi:hypothetical protein
MSLILSGTDGLSDVDGSAATPAIRGTDANTGIFFPAADTIAFAEGGAEVARFDSGGNLGIGTTSPNGRLEVVGSTGASFNAWFRTGDTTAANNAGGGFYNTSSATAASRRATLALDADGANLGGGDYFIIEKSGNSGTADILQYSNAAMRFGTNYTSRATYDMTLDASGNLLVGATSAADATVRTQSGSTSKDGRIQAWLSTSNGGSYGNLQLGSANTGTNTECSIKFVSGATALGNGPTSANGTQYDWGIGLSTYTVGGNVFGVACTANGGNNVKLNYNSTAWLAGSDERIKDITGNIENALTIISPWRTVFYTLKTDTSKDVKAGLIAQDVLQTLPEVVDVPVNEYNEKGELIPLSIAYTEIIPVLVKAIQEQQALITQLTDRITALESA